MLVQSLNYVILIGDSNVPDMNWLSHNISSTFANALCDLIFKFSLSQLVNNLTNIKGPKYQESKVASLTQKSLP